MASEARRLLVRGVVQGVGFRPFVFRLADDLSLNGTVCNLGDAGVEIVVEGRSEDVAAFAKRLRADAPPLARIDDIVDEARPSSGATGFTILASEDAEGTAGSLPPDIAMCDDCLEDIFGDSRYRGYWATSCTNCGPRFTIVDALPYDRPRTSMASFPMCPGCEAEYTKPTDRRYHAQTIACPSCGPTLRFDGNADDPIRRCRDALLAGSIVAIKGIGGTHLACDATSGSAVERLRARMGRPSQPFALMATEAVAERYTEIREEEHRQLRSARRPIVVLRRRPGTLPAAVAPGLHTVGIMLPYSGVHHLLLDGLNRPLVMTSANRPGRPMLIEDRQIEAELAGIADHRLLHDRAILARCDDSVLRFSGGQWRFLRRSRGYVPEPIPMALGDQPVLALGGETDVAVALYHHRHVVFSQHIGSVDNPDTLEFLQGAIEHLRVLTGAPRPQIIACDLHPRFLTSHLAEELAREFGADRIAVQHHEAHFASVLAEHGVRDAVGIVLDGYGYGSDGTAWGGELFLADGGVIRRVGSAVPVPLPGGDLATLRPLRIAASFLLTAGEAPERVSEALINRGMSATEAEIVLLQIERYVNAPLTSSAGRFLDAVSAHLALCTERGYEGEPAMRLEAAADSGSAHALPIAVRQDGPFPLLDTVLAFSQLARQARTLPAADVAATAQRFIADGFAEMALQAASDAGVSRIAFSGGVAYNDAISSRLRARVEGAGLQWMTNRRVPCGDGGVALGQAVLAAGGGSVPPQIQTPNSKQIRS